MDEIIKFINTVGFPIFVAVWMLYKTSKDNEKMEETISELKNAINLLANELQHRNNTKEGDDTNE